MIYYNIMNYKVNTKWNFIEEYIDKDLYHHKNIVMFIDSIPYYKNIDGKDILYCPYTHKELVKSENDKYIFIQVESYVIISNVLNTILNNHKYIDLLDYILSFDKKILNLDSRCIKFLPYTKFYWIQPPKKIAPNIFLEYHGVKDTFEYNTNKDFNVTFMTGHKNYCPGHKIRHEIWNRQAEIKIKKKFFYSQVNDGMVLYPDNLILNHRRDKTIMFENSMFAIVIENNKSDNYFTEKLIECIVSKTLPIYYGCPNISEYFNSNGIIMFENTNELINIVNNLTPNDYYHRLTIIEENFNKWVNMKSFSEQIEDLIYTKI